MVTAAPGPAWGELVPRVPVSAGALLRDEAGRLLIVKPTYKSGWLVPGGQMEADGESPWEACRREVAEETGLELSVGRLVAVDFVRPKPGDPGGVRLLFDGGTVSPDAARRIRLPASELSDYRFARWDDARRLLRPALRRRIEHVRAATGAVYLERGRPVPAFAGPLRPET